MKQNPNSLKNLLPPFSSTRQPKKNGRKPSMLKKYIKDNGLTADDISRAAKYLLPFTQKEINALSVSDETPMIMRLFARALLADMKNGNMDNVMRLLDRAVGKPKETIESLNLVAPVVDESMSEEDAQKLFLDIKAKIQGGKVDI